MISAVVEGERGGTPFLQIFCGWNGVPPNIVGVSRNGGAVAFRQMPCPNHVNTTVGAAAAATLRIVTQLRGES